MLDKDMDDLARNLAEATPGAWQMCRFASDHPDALPGEVGVHAPDHPDAIRRPDGSYVHGITICRGMTGPAKYANAALIALAPDLARAVLDLRQQVFTLRARLTEVLNEQSIYGRDDTDAIQ